jgi:ABC-type phosphate/phosphonate transport system substrate-binding protein
MYKRTTALVLAGVVLVSGSAACSSDDDDSANRDELVAELLADPNSDVTEEQAECFVDSLADELGEEETAAFAADPDAWVEEKMTAALEESVETAPEMEALGTAFEACDIPLDGPEVDAAVEAEMDLEADTDTEE